MTLFYPDLPSPTRNAAVFSDSISTSRCSNNSHVSLDNPTARSCRSGPTVLCRKQSFFTLCGDLERRKERESRAFKHHHSSFIMSRGGRGGFGANRAINGQKQFNGLSYDEELEAHQDTKPSWSLENKFPVRHEGTASPPHSQMELPSDSCLSTCFLFRLS